MTVIDSKKMCGGEVFNNKEQKCCGDVIVDRPEGPRGLHRCCGTQAFNKSFQKCKAGKIVPHQKKGSTALFNHCSSTCVHFLGRSINVILKCRF